MPTTPESAPEFIVKLLSAQPDYEWQVADIHEACGGRWTKPNLNNALDRLLKKGIVSRTVDPNRASWWSIVV